MVTLPYPDGQIGESILAEQTIYLVPQIKFLMCGKINKKKGNKMKPFPAPLPIIYKPAPCRNYSKSIHSHVKLTVPEIAKVMNILVYLRCTCQSLT